MSRVLIIFIGISFIASYVSAHGHLTSPSPRLEDNSVINAPVSFPLGQDFICKNKPASSTMTTLTAGRPTTMSWNLEAPHPGDCFAYISYDVNVSDSNKKWFKVDQIRDCNYVSTRTFILPSYLPSCDHCILRWEWYALHLQPAGSVEFYAQCADIKIVGGDNNGIIPYPQVTIPGHLPMDAAQYRNPYGNDAETGALIGPPLASPQVSSYNCQAAYGISCTVNPKSPGYNPSTPVSTPSTPSNNYPPVTPAPAATSAAVAAATSAKIVTPAPAATSAKIISSIPASSTTSRITIPSTPISSTSSSTPIISTPVNPNQPSNQPNAGSSSSSSSPSSSSSSSSSGSSSGSSSQTCEVATAGHMKCVTSETYSICDHGKWQVSQSCPRGLTCKPSGNYIYCVPQ